MLWITQAIIKIGFYIVAATLVLSFLGLIIVIWRHQAAYPSKNRQPRRRFHHNSNSYAGLLDQNKGNEILENGYRRQDYYDYGYTDTDIELWGMDEPGAPDPFFGGFAIADMADGKLDGNFDIFH